MVAQSKLTVGTFFSGIDIPVWALQDLIGAENIKHLFAVEKTMPADVSWKQP